MQSKQDFNVNRIRRAYRGDFFNCGNPFKSSLSYAHRLSDHPVPNVEYRIQFI